MFSTQQGAETRPPLRMRQSLLRWEMEGRWEGKQRKADPLTRRLIKIYTDWIEAKTNSDWGSPSYHKECRKFRRQLI